MAIEVINAAPQSVQLGNNELSSRRKKRSAATLPQHLPKFYFLASKGTEQDVLGEMADFVDVYGADTFESSGGYFNHQTLGLKTALKKGNISVAKRIVLSGAQQAGLMLKVTLKKVTGADAPYVNSTGDYVKADGTKTADLIEVTFTTVPQDTTYDFSQWAVPDTAAVIDTAMASASGWTADLAYIPAKDKGNYGNNIAMRFMGKAYDDAPNPKHLEQGFVPFNMAVMSRPDSASTAKPVVSYYGLKIQQASWNPEARDPITHESMFLGDVLNETYANDGLNGLPIQESVLGEVKTNNASIDAMLEVLRTAEATAIQEVLDAGNSVGGFGGLPEFMDAGLSTEAGKYLMDPLACTYSRGVPYLRVVKKVSATVGNNLSSIGYMGNGLDYSYPNSVTDVKAEITADYERRVAADMARYNDKEDIYQNMAISVENELYDTGYGITVKKAMPFFIARRKDTAITVSTSIAGEKLELAEEKTRAKDLYVTIMTYSESTYFATPTMRCAIVSMSGVMINNPYKTRVPLTLDWLAKMSEYCGAGNGKWKEGSSPEGFDGNIVDTMADFNIEHMPISKRYDFWAIGVNYILNFDRKSRYWGAFKTVYPDDSAVVNARLVVRAIQTCVASLERAHRNFSGRSDLTDGEFVTEVTEFLLDEMEIYTSDNRYEIIPVVEIDEYDKNRGFSWTARYDVKAGGMKTLQTAYTQSFRFDDEGEG